MTEQAAAKFLQGNLIAALSPTHSSDDLSYLGPLAVLVGTWHGAVGKNLIAVPAPGSPPGVEGSFRLLLHDYEETLTFTPVGVARNRGGDLDQFIGALKYEQRVTTISSNDPGDFPPGGLIHIETGMLLYLGDIKTNPGNAPGGADLAPFPLARSATIPHGDTITVYGSSETVEAFPTIDLVTLAPTDIGHPKFVGYTSGYPHYDVAKILTQNFPEGSKPETTTFDFDTDNGASAIVNVPYIAARASATRLQSTFWYIRGDRSRPDGDVRLQYAQNVALVFHKKFAEPGQIVWPHVTSNSLKKVG
jgi:hypothetical protein